VTSPAAEGQGELTTQVFTAKTIQDLSRIDFFFKPETAYEILAEKLDADGNVVSSTLVYKPLSYSLEYNPFEDPEVAEELAKKLALASGGSEITDPWQVFENAVKSLHKVVDPRLVFLIISLIFFLLDIAVRKFKWKWPHEIIRDRRARLEMSQKNG
jgi:hypothetical protein